MTTFVVYCSPAGTTRHVGQVIQRGMTRLGADVTILDLSQPTHDWSPTIQQINNATEPVTLFIGSPVYGGLPVPPTMDFIRSLHGGAQHYAVPYVTWGMVTSGAALWRMARALTEQGFTLIGGASIPALHSLHWQAKQPVGTGRPAPEDDAQITHLLNTLYSRIQDAYATPLALDTFAYQSPELTARLKTTTFDGLRKRMPPKWLEIDHCDQCGTCEQNCPASAITCDPFPQIDDSRCIVCYNCVRLCPEEAMQADLTNINEGLPEWAAHSAEPHITRIFL